MERQGPAATGPLALPWGRLRLRPCETPFEESLTPFEEGLETAAARYTCPCLCGFAGKTVRCGPVQQPLTFFLPTAVRDRRKA